MALFKVWNGEQVEEDFLRRLRELQHIRVVCRVGDDVIVEHMPTRTWWLLHDNGGGDLDMEKVNHPGIRRTLPYLTARQDVDTVTLSVWVAQVCRGEPVDFSWRADPKILVGLPIYHYPI